MDTNAKRYVGKAALVTGGGNGIGAACCERFSLEGAAVAVLDLNFAAAQDVVDDLTARGGHAIAIGVDVTQADSVASAVERAFVELGRLDVAVNNAGIGGAFHPLEALPIDQWHSTIAVNLTGVFYCLRAELPILATGGGGSIINMASIMGIVAMPNIAAYIAAKHGVVGLTKVAAVEYGAKNVRVNAVAPTFVRTALTDTVDDAAWQGLIATHPLGRMPTVDDVADVVAFLGSHEAASVTGSTYLVDSGFTAS
jgi:NAD(P)-dependent dehydrogenase (short-subunit alcohol dehydrogenase family)